MFIGEAFIGTIPDNAHPNIVVGRRTQIAPVIAASLAQPTRDHVSFMAVLRPGVMVKPDTLFVNKVATGSPGIDRMTWGAAQAGVALGVHDALTAGLFPGGADDWMVIATVWVNPAAADAAAVRQNNRDATLAAIRDALSGGDPALRAEAAAAVANPFLDDVEG